MLFVFIYGHLCPARIQYHMLLLLFTNNTTRVTNKEEKRTLPKNTNFFPRSSCFWVRVAESLGFFCVCRVLSINVCIFDPFVAIVYSLVSSTFSYLVSRYYPVCNTLIIKTYCWMADQLREVWWFDRILLPRCMLDELNSSLVIRFRANCSLCVLTSDCICYLSFF
jgi:hypothetical protein